MFGFRNTVFTTFLCATFSGCATIFSGSTQNVPVKTAEGTEVIDLDTRKNIPLLHDDSTTFIQLMRNRDYHLKFIHKGDQIRIEIPRSFEAQWLLPDYLCLIVPILVDLLTGDWHSFDGVAITFPTDSTNRADSEVPIYETFDVKKSGVFALLSICDVFPSSIFYFLPNGFSIGAGYEISPKWSTLFSAEQFGSNLSMPNNSEYFDLLTNFTSFQLEAHYKISGGIYAAGGGGVTHFWVDSLNYYSHDSFHNKITIRGLSKTLGSAFLGLGYSLKSFYFEIRHTLGFSKIDFPNGERGKYQTTGVRAGVILRF